MLIWLDSGQMNFSKFTCKDEVLITLAWHFITFLSVMKWNGNSFYNWFPFVFFTPSLAPRRSSPEEDSIRFPIELDGSALITIHC